MLIGYARVSTHDQTLNLPIMSATTAPEAYVLAQSC
jgi:DNA invertase Pin-like site-specific DNA recombinase